MEHRKICWYQNKQLKHSKFLKQQFWWFRGLMSGLKCWLLKWHENVSSQNMHELRGPLYRGHLPVRWNGPWCLGKRTTVKENSKPGDKSPWAISSYRLLDNGRKDRNKYDKASMAQISKWEKVILKSDLEVKHL